MQEKVKDTAKKALSLGILYMVFHFFMSFFRAQLSLMIPSLMTFITEELGITLAQGGLLYTTATTIMGIGMLLGSVIIDKIGASKSLLLSIVLTALCGIVGWAAPNYTVLMTSRVILGISHAISYPAAMTLVAERFHNQKQRGMASSVVQATNTLTNVLTQKMTVPMFLLLEQNWHNQMLIWGLSALVIAVVFFVADRKPEAFFKEYNAQLAQQDASAQGTPAQQESGSSLRKALKYRAVWSAIISFTGATWLYTVFMTYLPTILKTSYGMDATEASSITSLINMAGTLACLACGLLLGRIKNFKLFNVIFMILLPLGGVGAMLVKPGIALNFFVIIIGIAWFCNVPLINTAVMTTKGMTPSIFAAATALWTVLGSVLSMFIPSLFDKLQQVYGMQNAVLFLCLGGVVAIGGALIFPSNKKKKEA